jgi:hypothetical protein
MSDITTCRVCGDGLHTVVVADSIFDQGPIEWHDDNEDILCPAKDWDDAAGPYHEPKDSV